MSDSPMFSALRARFRAMLRMLAGPSSITVLSLDADEVARRLAARAPQS